MLKTVILFLSFLVGMTAKVAFCEDMTVVDKPNTEKKNDFYVCNSKLLSPSFFVKLPAGSVKPRGWIRKQLELQASGLVGRLHEINQWLVGHGPDADAAKRSAWTSPDGKGRRYSDEVPYWIRAFNRTGYALDDPKINARSKRWIEGMLSCQA